MSKFVSVEVPFQQFGNRRGLARHQIESDDALLDFFNTFKHCFEPDPLRDIMLYIEPNSSTDGKGRD